MTKKISISILLALLLVGCGGGGPTSATTEIDSSLPNTSTDQAETTIEQVSNSSTEPSLQDILGNPYPYEAPLINEADKQAFLDAINNARGQKQVCNDITIDPVPALKWNDSLYKAAYEHTNDLVLSDTFDHNGSNMSSDWTSSVQNLGRGSQAHERIANNGYQIGTVGENITAGFEDNDSNKPKNTPQMAVNSWLASTDGHCESLMNRDFTEVGMAYIEKEGTKYVHYWTQNLGAPPQ